MTKMYHAISADAFKKLQFQAGALLKTFDPEGTTPIKAEDMVCLTSGGISIHCKANTVDMGEGLDEVPENTYQLKHITSWDCGLSTTCMTISADTLKLSLGAADVANNKITVREDYEDADFQDIWWHGNLLGGGYAAVKLMKAASDGGLELKTTKDGKGNLNLSLKGHYDLTNTSKVPMEFYVKEAE